MLPRLSVSLRSAVLWSRLARIALLIFFAWLAGRFWHPYHGFTQFLQIDAEMAAVMVPSLREGTLFIEPSPGSYDGGYYAQIATSPGLHDPALRTAIDDVGYRARRILLGAVAWILGGGEPLAVAHLYAWLNPVLWFALAAVLWRVFPPGTVSADLAWAALLFGAGVLYSVRLALTDLTALLLTAGAVRLVESERRGGAAGLIGLAGLTRETAVLGVAALWPDPRAGRRDWGRALLLAFGALLPLLLWLLYVRHAVGASGAGQRNLAWPLAGWLHRWPELLRGWAALDNPLLVFGCVLEHAALTVQGFYLLLRPRRDCPWWRTGMASLVLLVCLGHAVWGGFPNAATRVLLPLTLAFNVRVVRDRAWLGWLLVGNLSVFAGVHLMWQPPGTSRQLPVYGSWNNAQLLETDARWSVAEWNRKWRWAWCVGEGGLVFRVKPHRPSVRLDLQLRGVTPREIEVWHAGACVWRGSIGDRPQWISLPELPMDRGRLLLELRSQGPPDAGDMANTARGISFACFGARVVE